MLMSYPQPVLLFCWATALYVAHHDGKALVWPPCPPLLMLLLSVSCASAAVITLIPPPVQLQLHTNQANCPG